MLYYSSPPPHTHRKLKFCECVVINLKSKTTAIVTYYIPAEQVKRKGFKSKNPGNRCLIVLFECIGQTPPAKKKEEEISKHQ